MAEPGLRRLTYSEYLDLEASTGVKHEYKEGFVVAMAGGSIAHADIGMNATLLIANGLRGRGCRASNSDQKIRVPETDFATYPDLAVFCGPRIPDTLDPHALTNPTLVLEVLSPSTEGYDRGEKFACYRAIPSLRQYVLLAGTEPRVEVFTRNPDESWTLRTYGPGANVPLDSIGLALAVDALYEGVELSPGGRLAGG